MRPTRASRWPRRPSPRPSDRRRTSLRPCEAFRRGQRGRASSDVTEEAVASDPEEATKDADQADGISDGEAADAMNVEIEADEPETDEPAADEPAAEAEADDKA